VTEPLRPGSGRDTLHGRSHPGSSWTTTNVGEAVPGVQTPLGWSIWGPAGEEGLRRAFHTIGALSKAEIAVPQRTEDRLFSLFFGRIALHLDLLCAWADRVPGTSGEAMARQIFSYVPPDYRSRPVRRYYPRVAARAGLPWVQGPRWIRDSRRRMADFWEQSVAAAPGLDAEGARRLLLEGADEFSRVIYHHTVLTLGAVQPVYDLLGKICADTDCSAQELMGGHGGHEETALLRDLWDCSRGRISMEQFTAAYGYHGPREGDISAVVWREDPEPVRRLIDSYRAKGDDAGPLTVEREQIERRHRVEQRFLAGLPRHRRPLARLVLSLATRYIPLRGVGKVAFLQAMDVTRLAARRLGAIKAAEGQLGDPNAVFFLTLGDLRDGWPGDAATRTEERRAYYEHYQSLDVPEVWQGEPEPVAAGTAAADVSISGIGASPGVVEGPVRVVLDPSDVQVEEGEILVARHTDPAWASLMFLSAGLISDIGGLMSHTAVVARELGIPCVVNTRTASRILNTGDRIRLDGTNGTVEVIARASSPNPPA
jgi:phosphohistidine swiveling domain-containing protein